MQTSRSVKKCLCIYIFSFHYAAIPWILWPNTMPEKFCPSVCRIICKHNIAVLSNLGAQTSWSSCTLLPGRALASLLGVCCQHNLQRTLSIPYQAPYQGPTKPLPQPLPSPYQAPTRAQPVANMLRSNCRPCIECTPFWAHATTSSNGGEQKLCTTVATMAWRALLGMLESLPHLGQKSAWFCVAWLNTWRMGTFAPPRCQPMANVCEKCLGHKGVTSPPSFFFSRVTPHPSTTTTFSKCQSEAKPHGIIFHRTPPPPRGRAFVAQEISKFEEQHE